VPEGTSLPEGDLRMVLTWGSTPSDLDSHLIGPTGDNSSYFHIYWSNKNYYYNGETYADLDLDDTTSYGPETTTIYNMNDVGIYSFYVYDYTNGSYSSSTEMSYSSAKVMIYAGETLIMTYNVPPGREGTLWHVFNYDAATRTITTVNEYVSDYDYSYWGY
ncbi:MAG: S-layer protein, partial [Agathobacter sp.]|nr:S-layer protein [Agathobacter sp.]